jgi:hypothetical protein
MRPSADGRGERGSKAWRVREGGDRRRRASVATERARRSTSCWGAARARGARYERADHDDRFARLPTADAVAALDRALGAAGWVTDVTLVDPHGESPSVTLRATARASSPAARALLEDAAATWLARRAGLEVAVRVDDAGPAEDAPAARSPVP